MIPCPLCGRSFFAVYTNEMYCFCNPRDVRDALAVEVQKLRAKLAGKYPIEGRLPNTVR